MVGDYGHDALAFAGGQFESLEYGIGFCGAGFFVSEEADTCSAIFGIGMLGKGVWFGNVVKEDGVGEFAGGEGLCGGACRG